jgi:phospholipid/cholesterol/gamma-HCH transport system substrate-binding protein
MRITKEVKTGFVVIVTLVAFYTLYNFLKGKNLFSSGETYYIKYENVSGLTPSKPVTVNGLKIGRIEEINIIDDKTPISFVVAIKLDRHIDFTLNTKAEIWEPGLMSGPEIRLLLDYTGTKAESGDTLQGTIKSSMTDLLTKELGPTKNKLDSLLVTTNSTMGSVDKVLDEENRQTLKEVLKNLDATLVSIGQTSQSLTRTSDGANQLIADNNAQLKNTLASAEQAMAKFALVADKMNNLELEKIMTNFEQASAKLNATLNDINSGKGTMGALLNDRELYDNLTRTSKTLDELLYDLKENPNRYVQFSIFGKKQAVPKEN